MNRPGGRFSASSDDPTDRAPRRRWQQLAALLTVAVFLAFLVLSRGRLW